MKISIFISKKVLSTSAFILFFLAAYSQSSSSYDNLAKEAFDKKNYDLCIEYCNKSIAIQPSGWTYWERAAAKYNSYKYSGAVEDYTSAISYYSDFPSLANLYFYRGESYYFDFKYQLAIDDYNKAYNYNYNNYGTLYRARADAYYFLGNYTDAKSDYSKCVSYFSSDLKTQSNIYYYIGQCEKYLKNNDASLIAFNKALDIDPGNSKVYELRANIWAGKNNYTNAIDDITKAINYGKDQILSNYFIADDYKTRAGFYNNLRDYDQAIKDAESAIATDSLIEINWDLGLYQHNGGYYKKAIESYNKAIAAQKNDTENIVLLIRNISLCYRDMLDYRSAVDEVNKALSMKMNFANAYWSRAIYYNSSKLYQKALDDYDKAILLLADNKISLASIYKERGQLYYSKLKDIDKAANNYTQMLSLNPDDETTLYEYGRFMVQSKKNIEDGKVKLKLCADKSLARDTGSNYSYAKLFLGEKEAAFNNMWRLLDKYRNDKYQYKWELHVVACLYALSDNPKKAIEYQEKAFKEGFYDFNHLLNDRDLISIQNLAEYKALLVKYKMPTPKYFVK
ncbi:tetratricopeptide repeat protein [mine drainage metagenome]|uniref:Tetratricopeptide repeat protein n=1 Tax=mine drainage metagenome TaxID=410659 RepID=A0A1J5TJ28_9ZZZZ